MGAPAIDSLKFFRLQRAELRGMPVTITRTGYTGDLGFEIWLANEHAEADLGRHSCRRDWITAWCRPASLALDIARIEAGLILQDVDYISANHALIEGQKSSPFELNLGWTVGTR